MPLPSHILRWLLFFIFALGLLIGILDYTDVSFKSDKARLVLLKNIKTVIGRDVSIDGDVYLTFSLLPKLLIEKIHIRNPDGYDTEDFITVSEVRIEVSLLPLLSGTFHIDEISADKANINLIEKKDGSYNWSFDDGDKTGEKNDEKQKTSSKKPIGVNRLSLGKFNLTNVSILYKDESRNQVIRKNYEHLLIDLTNPEKPGTEVSGSIQDLPYSIYFESDSIHSFVSGQPWSLYGTGEIAGSKTNVKANLQLIENAITGNIYTNVKNVDLGLLLEKLDIIKGQDATAEEINISTKLQGSDLTELYEQAETNLQLLRGYWKLSSSTTKRDKKLSFNKVTSFVSLNKPVELQLDGVIDGEAIDLNFKTNRLVDFFDEVHRLDVDLRSNIANTETRLKGALDLPIETKQFQLDISIKGKDLEKLNPILDAELPPFNDFSVTGKLIANKKGFILRSSNASIGDSRLQGSIVVETVSKKPLWIINLNSPQIQLKDFKLDIQDLQQPEIDRSKTSKQKIDDIAALKPVRRLIDIIQAPKMHFNLNLKVDKVLSGDDILGKARFQLHLRDNVVSLKNADIEVPGGRIVTSVTIEVVNNEISGSTELKIDKFDYGIAARIFDPDAQLDGIISTDIAIEYSGSNFNNLLNNATGHIDFALWPKNTRPAKILNLWTTNLYLILLPELKKKKSNVNCLVGLMNIEDGKMKEKLFAIDTTKLWISGNFNVDFKNEHVELLLFPRSKTARFFALQTPIRAAGKFSDINMIINPVDITGSYLLFITSPLHVPTRWVFGGKPPEDGSAVCEQFFDRDYVERLNKELRKKEQEEIDEILDSDY